MKLSRHAFTRFWDVHAWAGVVAGLVLYVMFLTGSITLFYPSLQVWEEPLCQRGATADGIHGMEQAFSLLSAAEKQQEVWLFPARLQGATQVQFADPDTEQWRELWLDEETHQLVPERERLHGFLYGLHFLWHDVTGMWLYRVAGFLAVTLLLAITTGVLIHVKDLLRQFHQFRPEKSRRVLWSDLHKVLGVIGLPFQVMYAYTGAFIVLAPLLLGWLTGPVFAGDAGRAQAAAFGESEEPSLPHPPGPPGEPLAKRSLHELELRARAALPDFELEWMVARNVGRAHGTLEVSGVTPGPIPARVTARLDAQTGEVLTARGPGDAHPAHELERWIHGLHFARFGGTPLRVLFFLLGLAGCATILSGNWIWLERRAAQHDLPGTNALARLTAGVGVGAIVAVAALFLASRVLPLDWAPRGAAEELAFFGALVGCVVWAFRARDEAKLWPRGLALASALLLPVPWLASRWSDRGLFGHGAKLAPVVGVDVALLGVAVALALVAWALSRNARRAVDSARGRESQTQDHEQTRGAPRGRVIPILQGRARR